MRGTVAITDHGWYEHLRSMPGLEEVNFWKPSSNRVFRATEFSPFFFKLRAPHNAICGYAFFARYSVLPDWLAWETFGEANGTRSFRELRERLLGIRDRIRFRGESGAPEIGCILLVQPTFFEPAEWVRAPSDWPIRTQSYMGYDLASGEGARIWEECRDRSGQLSASPQTRESSTGIGETDRPAYGSPMVIFPRLGQGTFRIAVTDAYGRACAVTQEHSLPALEAAHIQSYAENGPHLVGNGLLLRADLHNLFDTGYLTVSSDHRLEVSRRLKEHFDNGHTYYPLHGNPIHLPPNPRDHPGEDFLEWHRNHRYMG